MAVTVDGKELTASFMAIGDVVASYQAGVAITAGNRQIAIPLPSVRSGDVLSARPIGAVPVGYDIGAAYCDTDGTLVVIINHPALSLLQTFTVNLRILRIMA
jgi:hypothetical protein